MTKTEQAIRNWLNQYLESSRPGYARNLRQFQAWHGGPLLRATRVDIQEWIAHLEEQGRRSSTINRAVSAVSSFYTYAGQEGLVSRNPALLVRRPARSNAQRLGLSRTETKRLLTAAADHSPRTHALVALLVTTGLRITEALTATLDSIGTDGDERTVAVRRKGGAEHRIPLPDPTWQLIRQLHQVDTDTGPLIPGPRGGHIADWRARQLISEVGATAGLPDIHPHLLRHTAATLALEAGHPIERVQWMLGHSSPETTQRYVQAINRLKNSPSHNLATDLLGSDT